MAVIIFTASLNSCEVVGAIFKTGVGIGIFIAVVVLVIGGIIFGVLRGKK